MNSLLVVESPAKARTINKYLGKTYKVLASFGHVRDLPSKDGSVDPDNDFAMKYEINPQSVKHIKEIETVMKDADKLILAPDPDREGEAIAWHILEILKKKKIITNDTPVDRVVFNAVTKDSVLEAIKNPRKIDMNLVNAQQARRALDYLVGFTLSPILWRKLPGSKSAGRVQSVALRLICDREDEISAFSPQEYWDIHVNLETNKKSQKINALLTHINNEKLDKFTINNKQEADKIVKHLQDKQYSVSKIEKKKVKRNPYPPFTTSSMQQEAARKLGFSTKKTMMIAQKLYEGFDIGNETKGLITYMRTDGIFTAPEAIQNAREFIKKEYGDKYLPNKEIYYKNKVKNAQEAHEAIRPTDSFLTPQKLSKYLDKDHLALYSLIWKRMIASQMESVIMDQVIITIKTKEDYGLLKAVGSVINFDGFYILYNETRDDGDENEDESEKILPEVKENEELTLLKIIPDQHFTIPPPRYSEASLVKKMEELGIGRPSTYASIISVIQDRNYVRKDKGKFVPEERGRIVTAFLKKFFSKYVEYDYTAGLEDDLDAISNGNINWKIFLKKFWEDFKGNADRVSEKSIAEILEKINEILGPQVFGTDENGSLKNNCPNCKNGKLGIKIGRFGTFIGCSNYPDCKYTKQIDGKESEETGEQTDKTLSQKFETKTLGVDEETGFNITLRKGPYGFYVQLGEEIKTDKKTKTSSKGITEKKGKSQKPKRAAIPKSMQIDNIDIKLAKQLLSLPREIGLHPETGKIIKGGIGPFGPYLLHDNKFSSLKNEDVLTIDLDKAVKIIEEVQNKKKTTTARKNKSVKKKIARKPDSKKKT